MVRAAPIADVGEELIHVIPSALWVLVIGFALYFFREPIRSLLGRVESARLPGNVELRFRPAFESAVKNASERLQLPKSALGMSEHTVERLLNRARRNADVVVGARVLWVDNQPQQNVGEREAMDALGISVTTARATEEAGFFLARGRVDLVISDMTRPDEESDGPKAGYKLRDAMHSYGVTAPLIFYVLDLDLDVHPPVRTFAITNRPDELLDYVIDALIVRADSNARRR